MGRLLDLPPEEIHLLALNPSLPLAHPLLRSGLNPQSAFYTAKYLLRLYGSVRQEDIMTRAVRHRICSTDTLGIMERLWNGKADEPSATPKPLVSERVGHKDRTLSCAELPRRLFRSLSAGDDIDPLLRYLFDRFSPSANSHKGYPLCRAVLAQNIKYIDFLLRRGANPFVNDGLAIEIAISKHRLDIVKLLVEGSGGPLAEGAKQSGHPPMDKVKISTKIVEHAMKSGSKDIVHYFVHEKGVMPPLRTIMKMSRSRSGPGSTDNSRTKRARHV